MFMVRRRLLLALIPVLVCASGGPPQPAPDRNGKGQKPPSQVEDKATMGEEPDSAAVAKAVKQLGSDDFGEREAATRVLAAIGPPALEVLRKTGPSSSAPAWDSGGR
jgi:hypothetical protein